MDITQEEAVKIYFEIASAFNENRARTGEELASFIENKTNLFSAPISTLFDISSYRAITGNQASNLVLCILQFIIPKYKELTIKEKEEEYQKKIDDLEKEIDRLSNMLFSQWDFEDDNKEG